MQRIILKFVILCLLAIILTYFHRNFLNLESLQIESLSNVFTSKQISKFIEFSQVQQNYIYLVVSLNILLKTFAVAIILFVYCIFQKTKIHFKKVFEVTITSEFIFILPIIYEIVYFNYFKTNYSFDYIQEFSSLSLFNLFDNYTFEPWYIYPLQTLNLFEVAYVFYLGIQIAKLTKSTPDEGLKMVVFSYVPALLLWVCTIMFLTLNYS